MHQPPASRPVAAGARAVARVRAGIRRWRWRSSAECAGAARLTAVRHTEQQAAAAAAACCTCRLPQGSAPPPPPPTHPPGPLRHRPGRHAAARAARPPGLARPQRGPCRTPGGRQQACQGCAHTVGAAQQHHVRMSDDVRQLLGSAHAAAAARAPRAPRTPCCAVQPAQRQRQQQRPASLTCPAAWRRLPGRLALLRLLRSPRGLS